MPDYRRCVYGNALLFFNSSILLSPHQARPVQKHILYNKYLFLLQEGKMWVSFSYKYLFLEDLFFIDPIQNIFEVITDLTSSISMECKYTITV